MRISIAYIFCLFVLFPTELKSQSLEELLEKAEKLKLNFDDNPALTAYENIYRQYPDNFEAIWNISYMHTRLGWLQENKTKRVEHYKTALKFAEKALAIDESSSDANFVMAASVGGAAEKSGARARVESAHDVKKYCDLAIKYDANNYWALYTLGRWNYELDNASWAEKAIANSLLGGLPKGATTENAVSAFQKAVKLFPDYNVFYYYLGLALKKLGRKKEAAEVLHKGLEVRSNAVEVPEYQGMIKELLDKVE